MRRLQPQQPQALVARAPLRVSFGGGGTDLPAYYRRFGGLVVSAAITRYCYVVAEPPVEAGIGISSADFSTWETFAAGVRPVPEGVLSLPKAALEWFWRSSGGPLEVDLFLASEVAPGSGLGSSSAMAVALVLGLAAHLGLRYSPEEVAEIASWIEIERLRMPIGKQDQYASAFGGINCIEFTRDGVRVTPLPLSRGVHCALSERLLLFSTGQTRNSAAILRQQSSDAEHKRAVINSLHRLKAVAFEMRAALLQGRLDDFGQLLDLGWQEKKRLSRRISSAAIDRCYEVAREHGALGGKIVGAGGGGFLLLYCPPQRQPAVRSAMSESGLQELSFEFDFTGAQVLTEAVAAHGLPAVRSVGARRAAGREAN